MNAPDQPTFAYAAIITHARAPRCLLLASPEGWNLPRWVLDDGTRPYWQTVDGVNCALHERFGLATITLRCLRSRYDPQTMHTENSYLAELSSHERLPAVGHRWIGPEELALVTLARPEDRALLADWFGGRLGGFAGPPWFRPGWATAALAWIAAQVAHLGLVATAPPEQLRSWERGSIWRVPTATGMRYFKAVPPVFAHEVALPPALNAWRPGCATDVLARDESRGWMLLDDLGDRDLFGARRLPVWEAALREYAELQVACVPRRDELLALGCPHRPLAELPAGHDALLADEAVLLSGSDEGLTLAQIASLRDLAPALRADCAALAAFNLPETIDHGDLWGSNIFLDPHGGDGCRFHDWSDSSLTHPFFGPLLTLLDAEIAFPNLPDARDRLRDAYLAPWQAYAPLDRLRAAFALAQRLAPLDHALLYHRRILPAMRAKWEMAEMLSYFAKMTLDYELRTTNYE